MHILCTICSDLVNQADNIQVTKCGHIFHFDCLIKWIDRSKTCPQCRNKVTEKCIFRMYPTISNDNTGDDVTTLQSRLDDAQLQLRQQIASLKKQEVKFEILEIQLKKNQGVLKATEKKLDSKEAAVSALKEQLEYLKVQNRETQKLKEENESLKKNLLTLNGLQKVLNATSNEVEQMLESYSDLRTIATFATALKRALCDSESKKNESRDRIQTLKQQLSAEKRNMLELQVKMGQLEEKVKRLIGYQDKYECLKKKRKAVECLDREEEAKQRRTEDPDSSSFINDYDTLADTPVPKRLNSALMVNGNSFRSMVTGIEESDSPYLRLRHSGLALTALQRRPQQALPGPLLKPSELAILNAAKNTVTKPMDNKFKYSIFEQKEKPAIRLTTENDVMNEINISYDGLGGHSKMDNFPVPNNRPALKNYAPKLTTKHRLKRPTPVGNHDIGKMLEKLQDNIK